MSLLCHWFTILKVAKICAYTYFATNIRGLITYISLAEYCKLSLIVIVVISMIDTVIST